MREQERRCIITITCKVLSLLGSKDSSFLITGCRSSFFVFFCRSDVILRNKHITYESDIQMVGVAVMTVLYGALI